MVLACQCVERIAHAAGEAIEAESQAKMKLAAESPESIQAASAPMNIAYIEPDGTGVPMRAPDLEGIEGKDGKAKTREAKIGAVFSQTGLDDKGRPVRDKASTSYASAIEGKESFGLRLFTEALMRGALNAAILVFLADGAYLK